jgi:ABC-2 type transport system permease protein
MTGLLWAELRRFAVRPAIRWIAAGMLMHVALAVALTAFEAGASTLAGMLEQGHISFYALASVFLAYVTGVLLVTGDAAAGGTRAVLTVEPRRGRVYWSKVAAAALAVLPGVAAAYTLLALGMYAVHARSGMLAASAPDLGLALTWSGVRVLALAACAAAGGAALGVLVRRWWVAVPLVVVWLLVEETVLSTAPMGREWFLSANADWWVRGTRTVLFGDGLLAVPLVHSALLLLSVTVLLTVLGWVVFRRRDVR